MSDDRLTTINRPELWEVVLEARRRKIDCREVAKGVKITTMRAHYIYKGYWYRVTPEELEAAVAFLRRRLGVPTPLGRTIRETAEARGLGPYRLAKLANIPIDPVSRFLKGERSLSLATAEKLAAALRLELVPLPEVESSPASPLSSPAE